MTNLMKVSVQDNIAIIQFNNGENRINLDFLASLNSSLDEVLSNENVVALITTGEGKFFSNGIELDWLFTEKRDIFQLFWKTLFSTLYRIITFPMPTIAAINGHAFAGGLLLALAHDYRVMNSHRGWIALNEVHMPARFPDFLQELIRLKLPVGTVQTEVVAMGRRLTATQAQQLQIVQNTYPPQELIAESLAFARNALRDGEYNRNGMIDIKSDMYASLLPYMDKEVFLKSNI